MTTYTENDLDGASIDWKSSTTRVPSPIIEDKESTGSAQLSISESAHFNVYNNHSEYQVAEEDGLSVWECIRNVETYYRGIEGEWRDICLRRRRRAAVMTEQRPPSPSTVPSEFFDAFSLSFHWSTSEDIPDPFADEVYLESSTTHFTALTFPGREFAFQDILRPSRFQPPRQIKIAFYIPVDGFTSPNEFETQWNFISIHVAALAQQVASPWQNIVVIIEGPPRWIGVHPDILMLFRKLGILFETNQSIDYVGRVSLYPPYHMERDEIFERPILGTIYERTVQPTTHSYRGCFENILIPTPLQVIAVAPHQYRNDPTYHNLQYHDNWAVAVCNVLKPEFIVTLPCREMAKTPHPNRFLRDLWRCHTRFSNSKHEHVNQCVLLTPLEFQTGRVGIRPVRSRVGLLKEPLPHPKQSTTAAEHVVGFRSQPELTARDTPPVENWNYIYILSGLLVFYIIFFSTFYTYILFSLGFFYIIYILCLV
ncbi:uncharacterized protein FMAN_15294 [Fusarium mangiferae]|uniref:Uncharacterized protein n=1 Tax=Fusarium mangiferae TaxID=192010 RepID=A0A1L7UJ10_FUSMA|nr:uncharacterized protein FMAN_15294 [Fusarium mangiferae]CVL07156.1 uncharacterized protein FMAN_15294 [Fusarium mangiferae]